MFSKKSAEPQSSPTPPTNPGRTSPMASKNSSTFSVLGSDLAIKGDIKASADLHIDGTIEGDISCTSLVQGETSKVIGAVKAETARLAGTVEGSITVRELVILKTARIIGDVFYDALTIEQGAEVEGRFAHRERRANASAPVQAPKSESGGKPDLQIAN